MEQIRVAPSTYYEAKSHEPSQRARQDARLGAQLLAIFQKNYSVYGRRKLTAAAKRAGLDLGRDQVARIMKLQHIRGASRSKKRFTTHANDQHVRAPDLVNRNFTASRPDELWVADFTYCSTWSGVIYVSFITDVFSRRIVGWKASRNMTDQLVVDALNMAAWTRRHTSIENLRSHSDAGSQYTSLKHTERLEDFGITASIGTVGDSYDNAMAESMFAIFKTELFRNPVVLASVGGHWKGLDDLEIATCEWISWFNSERIHSELQDLTPLEVEANYRDESHVKAA